MQSMDTSFRNAVSWAETKDWKLKSLKRKQLHPNLTDANERNKKTFTWTRTQNQKAHLKNKRKGLAIRKIEKWLIIYYYYSRILYGFMMSYLSIFFGARIILLQSPLSVSSSSCNPSVHLPKWSEPGGKTRRNSGLKQPRDFGFWPPILGFQARTLGLQPTKLGFCLQKVRILDETGSLGLILLSKRFSPPGVSQNHLVASGRMRTLDWARGLANSSASNKGRRPGWMRQLPGPFYGRFSNFHKSHCKYPGWLSKNYRDLSWLIYWGLW